MRNELLTKLIEQLQDAKDSLDGVTIDYNNVCKVLELLVDLHQNKRLKFGDEVQIAGLKGKALEFEKLELLKLVLRKFYYNDEQSVGFGELQGSIEDCIIKIIGIDEMHKFRDSVTRS